MREKRTQRRRILAKKGTIRFDGANGPNIVGCIVKDISVGGAQLLVATAAELPPEIKLDVAGIIGQDCQIRWRAPGRLGVEFVTASSPEPDQSFEWAAVAS